jgi:hypothetical protein
MDIDAADERRHPLGSEAHWNESWYFDFAATDGSLGGYVRLGLVPGTGSAWYWAYVVGERRPLVAVRDHEVPMPSGSSLEVRAEGLWSELVCETPLDHWTIGLEAFAVALDDPAEAYRGERGDRVALGLDLEWEAVGGAYPYTGLTRYEQACRVHGDVLIGDERLAVDCFGERDHSWGVRDWWLFPWCWTAGRLDDGTAFHAARPLVEGVDVTPGFVLAPDASEPRSIDRFTVETVLGDEGLPRSAAMRLDGLDLDVTCLAQAPVLLRADDGRESRFPRALCRFTDADGRTGTGWTEWLQLPSP